MPSKLKPPPSRAKRKCAECAWLRGQLVAADKWFIETCFERNGYIRSYVEAVHDAECTLEHADLRIVELGSYIAERDRAIDDFRKREAEHGLEVACLAERCEMLDGEARELRITLENTRFRMTVDEKGFLEDRAAWKRELTGAQDNLDAQSKLNTEHRQNIAQANGQIKELQDSVEQWKSRFRFPRLELAFRSISVSLVAGFGLFLVWKMIIVMLAWTR
jgi:hypothetical protein